jgi:hypothetical protein
MQERATQSVARRFVTPEEFLMSNQETKVLKKTVLLGAGIAFTTIAHAQSSVTLYGLVDLGITYLNSAQTGRVGGQLNGRSLVAMSDGHATGLSGSRWGALSGCWR